MVTYRNDDAEREVVACAMKDIPHTLGVMDEMGLKASDFGPSAEACIKACEELAAQGHEECDCISVCDVIGMSGQKYDSLLKYAAECYEQGGMLTMLHRSCEAVCKGKKKQAIHSVLHDGAKMLDEGDPDSTIAKVVSGLSSVEFGKEEDVGGLEALQAERDAYRNGTLMGVPTYFMGKQLGMLWPEKKNGDLIVLAGRSSDGKTTMMLNDAYSDGERGIPCGVIELEMRTNKLYERMACKRSAINPMWFTNHKWSDKLAARFDQAYHEIADWPIYVTDEPHMTLDEIEAKAFIMKKRYGIRSLYIDYLQLLTPTADESRQPPRVTITQWSRRLKCMARELGIPITLLSQLARTEDTRDGELTPGMPTKEMLKESGSIENDADVVALICKKPKQPRSEFTFMQDYWRMMINIDKNRGGPTGALEHAMFPACYHIEEQGKATEDYLLRYEISKSERGY